MRKQIQFLYLHIVQNQRWGTPINIDMSKKSCDWKCKSQQQLKNVTVPSPHLPHLPILGSFTLHVQLGLGWDVFQNGWDGSQPLRHFVTPPPHRHH